MCLRDRKTIPFASFLYNLLELNDVNLWASLSDEEREWWNDKKTNKPLFSNFLFIRYKKQQFLIIFSLLKAFAFFLS